MDSFDKSMEGLFENEGSLGNIPSGFSWESNKAGIYAKMPDKEPKRRYGWILLGGLLLLGAALGLLFTNQTDSIANATPASEKADANESIPAEVINFATETQQSTTNELQQQPTTTDNNTKTETITDPALIEQPQASETRILDNAQHNNLALANTTTLTKAEKPTTTTRSVNPLPQATKMATTFSANTAGGDTKKLPASNVLMPSSNETTAKLPFLTMRISQIVSNSPSEITKSLQPFTKEAPAMPKAKASLSLLLNGGSLLTMGSYSSGSPKNSFNSWLPGYNAGLGLRLLATNNFGVTLGYNHRVAVQHFAFSSQDSVPVTVKDVVVEKVYHSLTGETENVTADVEYLAARNREYDVYNTFRSHNFYLAANYFATLNRKIAIVPTLGFSVSMLSTTEGFNLDHDHEIIHINDATPYYRSTSIELLSGVELQYMLSPKVALTAGILGSKSLGNLTNDSQETLSPLFIGFNGGISYNF